MTSETKCLYILIAVGGDGSYYPHYTFNRGLVMALKKAYDEDRMDYENGIGCDGDGFHYDFMTVPVDCTASTLNITLMDDDYAEQYNGELE